MSSAQQTPRHQQLQANPARVCVFHAVHMSLFPIAIITLFLRDDLGLSMLDIFALQAIFGAAVALLEFPGGYLADRIGYRLSLAIGAGAASLGWIVYALANGFLGVALAEVLMALGIALISGADSALMYESLLATDDEGSYTRWFARYRSLGNVGEGTAALLGGLLYAYAPRLPFLLQAGLWVANVFIALTLVEPVREQGPAQPALRRAKSILRFAAFEAPQLRAVIGLFLALAMPTYVMVWILPTYARDAGIAAAWMGPIWAGASYVVAASSLLSPRLRQQLGVMPALAGCVGLIAVGYVGLGLTHAWYGFLFYGALCVLRGVHQPLLQHQEQRLIPSSDRASLLSLKSLAFRAAFVLLAPGIGYALDMGDQHQVLLVLAVPFTAVATAAWMALAHATRPVAVPAGG